MSSSKYEKSVLETLDFDAVEKSKKKVHFGDVRVYYFQRTEANIYLARKGSYPLSMTSRHFQRRTFNVNYAKTRESSRALQPYKSKQRYEKLKAAGCKIYEDEVIEMLKKDNPFRGHGKCGCLCKKTCTPIKCPCAIEGLDCLNDEALCNCECNGTLECKHHQICGGNRHSFNSFRRFYKALLRFAHRKIIQNIWKL